MKRMVLVLALLSPFLPALAETVHAQMGPPPLAVEEAFTPKASVEAGLLLAIPVGSDMDNTETSFGFRLAGAFYVKPNLRAIGSLRFISVALQDAPSDYDVSYLDFGAGGQYLVPVAPNITGYGGFELLYSTTSASYMGSSSDDSAFGIALVGGAQYVLANPRIVLAAEGQFVKDFYSADLNGDGSDESVSIAWLTLGASGSYRF